MNESKLKKLFDYQKFASNLKLQKLIKETEQKYPQKLSDDDLEYLNAAGPTVEELQNDSQSSKM